PWSPLKKSPKRRRVRMTIRSLWPEVKMSFLCLRPGRWKHRKRASENFLIGSRPVQGKEWVQGLTEGRDQKLEMAGRRSEKETEEGLEEGPEGERADRPADFSLVMWAMKSLARS